MVDASLLPSLLLLHHHHQKGFISKFEVKINQLRLAVAATILAKHLPSPQEAAGLYTQLLEKRGRLGLEAALYLDMELGLLKLKQVSGGGGSSSSSCSRRSSRGGCRSDDGDVGIIRNCSDVICCLKTPYSTDHHLLLLFILLNRVM